MFGFALAVLLSLIGVAIGTTVSFYIARLVGRKPLSVIFGEERFEKYSHIINSKKSHFIIFILYMIPGVPKDILPYAAGVSKMRFLSLLIISLVGRFPAMICSLLMGNFMMNKNYIGMVAVAVFVAVILLLCFIKRNSLNRFMDKYYNSLNDKERSHSKTKNKTDVA